MLLRRVLLAALLGTAAALVAVAPARGDGAIYIVTGTGDDPSAACGPYAGLPGWLACDSLRAALAAADANPGTDVVGFGTSGTFALTQGELTINADVSIAGPNARTATIQGNGSSRVLSVGAGVNVGLSGVTIAGGRAGADEGGNILNGGSLVLTNARVTDGAAAGGGGIANTGTLYVTQSLIDKNSATAQGGAILNRGGANAANTVVSESTIFENRAPSGGGIRSLGSPSNQVSLVNATLAGNSSVGISVDQAGGTWSSYGSLLANNHDSAGALANCDARESSGSTNSIEDGTGCFPTRPNVSATGLATALSDQGGHTDVLTISPAGRAKGFVNPCNASFDQRSAPRSAGGACDVGAYEEGATAPPISGFQVPTSTPVPPTPTPAPPAKPEAQKSVAGEVVSGKVRVRKAGSKDFVDLDPTQPIPLGSTIDTTQGTIKMTALQAKDAKPQTGNFFDGMFKVTQTKKTTDLTLNETLAKCPKAGKASAGAKKPKSRKLWGNGSGSFRTRGQYSAATVRGTEWLVQDTCAGTLTRVKTGAVSVRDLVRRKTIILRAGKKYLAKP